MTEAADEEALEKGRLLFAGPIRFLKGVVALDGLPPPDAIEVAFAGRSNVGKSSLINALTGRRDIARASNTPGRTRELNFFGLAGDRLLLVDMPGYGYAKAEKALVEKWQRLLRAYLRGRVNLRRVFVLIDARHGIKPVDEETLSMLDETAVNYQVVLTKADKISTKAQAEVLAATRERIRKRPAAHPEVILTSSETGTGLPELRAAVAGLLG
ncbi:MAG: ribosome biogenesis GTP-binding protein YihA/YsxC [Hyphomicrobiales bacterium]